MPCYVLYHFFGFIMPFEHELEVVRERGHVARSFGRVEDAGIIRVVGVFGKTVLEPFGKLSDSGRVVAFDGDDSASNGSRFLIREADATEQFDLVFVWEVSKYFFDTPWALIWMSLGGCRTSVDDGRSAPIMDRPYGRHSGTMWRRNTRGRRRLATRILRIVRAIRSTLYSRRWTWTLFKTTLLVVRRARALHEVVFSVRRHLNVAQARRTVSAPPYWRLK